MARSLYAGAGHFKTRYEVAIQRPDGHRWLLGYTAQVSKIGVVKIARTIGDTIIRLTSFREDQNWKWSSKPRTHFEINGWTVGFTGRTENEARHAPLPLLTRSTGA